MAIDKAIDSTAFDSKLKSVADAIRSAGGTTEPMSFPSGMVEAVSAIQAGADNAPFTEILTGTQTFSTISYTWTLPKSENLLAGYMLCTNYWNVQDDIPESAQQLFFTTRKSFGYFPTSDDTVANAVAGVYKDMFSVSNPHDLIYNGELDLTDGNMGLLGTYWYCLIYGVKS